MDVTDSNFRHCLGCFASGVTIVTTTDKNNKPQGLTISSFASLSLQPPLVSFNLDKQSTYHDIFLENDAFIINILAKEQEHLSVLFSSPDVERWANLDYTSNAAGLPIIPGCLATIECTKKNVYEGGDHSIFIGRVIALDMDDSKKPLLYYKGQYNTLG